jgi:hypothetical protein
MNYPAASSGVSIGIFIIAPRGGEADPCPPWRIEKGFEKPERTTLSGF